MAGPVRVTSGEVGSVTHRDSWMFSRPVVAGATEDRESVVRVVCETRMPCRSSVDVVVPPGVELVIVSSGVVTVDRFDGGLTVLAPESGVALGPVTGSARVLADGDVTATGLGVDSFDAESLRGEVTASFAVEPALIFVAAADAAVALMLPALDDGATEAEMIVNSMGEVDISRSQAGGSPLDVDE